MELKVVQDVVRGRTAKLPLALMARIAGTAAGRRATAFYLARFGRALLLRRRALQDGALLRDIAWARLHMRVVDVWLATKAAAGAAGAARRAWLDSYERVLMRFPTPTQA